MSRGPGVKQCRHGNCRHAGGLRVCAARVQCITAVLVHACEDAQSVPPAASDAEWSMQACLSKNPFDRPKAAELVADLKAARATCESLSPRGASQERCLIDAASPYLVPASTQPCRQHLPHAPSFVELQQRYQHLRVSLDVLVPGRQPSPKPGMPRGSSSVTPSGLSVTPPGLSGCGLFSRSGAVQFDSRSRSGESMQGGTDASIPSRSGELQPGKRMPYTTSVRVGLAGISRPLHALSSHSSSGWFSDGSVSRASYPAPSVA